MSSKAKLVPKLRFPEFRGAEGWDATPLGELGAIVTGKTPSTKDDDLWGGEILFITPTDITEGEKYQLTTQRTVVETTGTKVLPPGSVVYTCIASIGKMALTVVPSVTNQQINAVVPNGKTAREFIYYSLANLTPWIKSIPATSTLPIINKTQFSGFIIPHPEGKPEQQKIAECLSSVDELIGAQARKVDALKTHKKGLMQQLFPREGETQPRLRFPEFRKAGRWEMRRLGDLADVSASGDLDSATFSPERSETHCFPIFSNAVENEGIYGFSSTARHEANSVTITARGTLGRAFLRTTGFVGIGRLIVVTNFIGSADPRFLKECWDHLAVIPQEVTSIPQLTAVAARATVLPFPTLPEQHRIASCLSSLDALITAEAQKLEALKTHKRGLMQQLFPSPEATGATRVSPLLPEAMGAIRALEGGGA